VLSRALPMLPHPHGMRVVHMAGLTLTRSVRAVSAHTVAHFAWLSTSLAEVPVLLVCLDLVRANNSPLY
jgi:hypothetical protein